MLNITDLKRRWQLPRTSPGPLRDYLEQPFPASSLDYREVEYLALDLETTGLDARKHQILSVGYVVLRGCRIDLSTAQHRLVQVDAAIPESSAIIHQITDDEAAGGGKLTEVMSETLAALRGRVLIAHHARVEKSFLGAACKRIWGKGLIMPVVDTQAIALRLLQRRQIAFKGSDLRLHALCERYNLPRYGAHNALSDALAAAELFLAQAAYRDSGGKLRLGDFLS